MKKFALIAIASIVAATGAVSPAFASLSDREATVWHQKDLVQVAGRGGGDNGGHDKGGRSDGGKNQGGKGRDKKDKVIWRVRDKNHRPFFLFRIHDSRDCFTRRMPVQNPDGTVTTKSVEMCD